MGKLKKLLILSFGVAMIGSQFSPALVLGATPGATPSAAKQPGQALEIDPPLLNLSGNPGQSVSAHIAIRNISSGPLIVSNQINDFTAKGETGVPQIIFKDNAKDPYSLVNYVSPLPDFLLEPNQEKQLTLDINIPPNGSPGGHYGVIRFTGTPASLNGASGVSLSASLGTLVLLTVNGHIVENLTNHAFTVSSNGKGSSGFFQTDPFVFSEVIQNTGNEHVIPTGILTLKDMFGHVVLRMNINEGLGNVLPGSMRQFSEEVSKVDVGSKRFFGRYTASYDVSYGTPKKELQANLSFWVIPIYLIVIWLAILIGGFFLIRFGLKRYNQHILDKAQKSKKK